MKYNEDALNISAEFYKDIQEDDANDEIEQMQNELVSIILKKCKQALKEDKKQNKGIVRVQFIRKFWENGEEGYDLIWDLINANQFDAFARQYCFYLGKVKNESTEYSHAFIEIVWDYKTYFEYLSMSKMVAKQENEEPGENVFAGALKGARQMEISQQIDDMEAFASKVAEYRNATSQKDVVKLDLKAEV